jgi:hypothetical protein
MEFLVVFHFTLVGYLFTGHLDIRLVIVGQSASIAVKSRCSMYIHN